MSNEEILALFKKVENKELSAYEAFKVFEQLSANFYVTNAELTTRICSS